MTTSQTTPSLKEVNLVQALGRASTELHTAMDLASSLNYNEIDSETKRILYQNSKEMMDIAESMIERAKLCIERTRYAK